MSAAGSSAPLPSAPAARTDAMGLLLRGASLPVVRRSDVLTFSDPVVALAGKRGRPLLPDVAPMVNESAAAVAAGEAASLRTLHEAAAVLSSATWRDWSDEARTQRWAYAGRSEMNL